MASKQRYRICVAYDGTDFLGWQKQPNSPDTIQGILENVLSKIFNDSVSVVGSGRTDRGVHALRQWAHFDLKEGSDVANLAYKMQRMTPDSISIKILQKAPEDFHAQISAQSKCYKYRISVNKPENPFIREFAWNLGRPLNQEILQSYAQCLLGEWDFTSFQSQGTQVKSPVRKILKSHWISADSGLIEYQIQGTGFLKQMVRNIVGTMIKLEQNQASSDDFQQILQARDRAMAAAPAPPQGLYLTSVQYPQSLDNKCRKL